MRLLLSRLYDPASFADFDPATGDFRIHPADAAVPTDTPAGWFDVIGWDQRFAAFYRTPNGALEVHVAGQRVAVPIGASSEYEPIDPAHLPWRLRGTERRVWRLYDDEELLFVHEYRAESVWERLLASGELGIGRNGGPPAYDLLYRAHCMIRDDDLRAQAFDALGAGGVLEREMR